MNKPSSIKEYITALPPEKRVVVEYLRKFVLDNIPEGIVEVFSYGMLCYVIPLERYPNTYNKQPLAVISIASQKNYFSLYLTCAYSDSETGNFLKEGFTSEGKKLDMGKSCIRFKRLDDLSLKTIREIISQTTPEKFIEIYEKVKSPSK